MQTLILLFYNTFRLWRNQMIRYQNIVTYSVHNLDAGSEVDLKKKKKSEYTCECCNLTSSNSGPDLV